MRKLHAITFLIYLVVGLYFLNSSFAFYKIPEAVTAFNQVIEFVAAILIMLGGINYLRLGKHRNFVVS